MRSKFGLAWYSSLLVALTGCVGPGATPPKAALTVIPNDGVFYRFTKADIGRDIGCRPKNPAGHISFTIRDVDFQPGATRLAVMCMTGGRGIAMTSYRTHDELIDFVIKIALERH